MRQRRKLHRTQFPSGRMVLHDFRTRPACREASRGDTAKRTGETSPLVFFYGTRRHMFVAHARLGNGGGETGRRIFFCFTIPYLHPLRFLHMVCATQGYCCSSRCESPVRCPVRGPESRDTGRETCRSEKVAEEESPTHYSSTSSSSSDSSLMAARQFNFVMLDDTLRSRIEAYLSSPSSPSSSESDSFERPCHRSFTIRV